MRRRLYVASSILYVILGLIIVTRSVTAHVVPVGILGLVFIALGVVRIRDLVRQESTGSGH